MIYCIQSVILLLFASQTVEQGDETMAIPIAAMETLQRNSTELSGLEYVITVSRRSLVTAAELPSQLEIITTPDFAAAEEYLIRIDRQKLYQKMAQEWNGGQVGEATYDGHRLYSGRPPKTGLESILSIDTAEGRIEDLSQSGFPKRHFYWSYFEEAGYHVPAFPDELGDLPSSLVVSLASHGKLLSWTDDPATGLAEVVLEGPDPWARLRMTPQQIKDAVAHLQGTSREYQTKVLEGQAERLKTSPFRRYRLLLDPMMGYAVKEKWEETLMGELLGHSVGEEFQKAPNRMIWLPKICRTVAYANENFPDYISPKPIYECVATLKSVVEREFSDKDFELWYDSPGGMVFDYTAQGATRARPVSYQVPGTVADLDRASESRDSKVDMRRWIIIANVAVFALLAIYLLVFRRRAAK